MKTNIVATCSKCGKPARVCVFKSESLTVSDSRDFSIFCEICAAQGIRELPPCSHLTIAVVAAPRAIRVRKEYQVLELDPDANRAKISAVSTDRTPSHIIVARYDAVPKFARTVGSTFAIVGIPEELAYFEGSGQ